MPTRKSTRFSDYFRLEKNQAELDFVDIPIETDIPLFVDPYALHISSQDWLRECGNSVVTYFQTLVKSIRKDDERTVLQLLDNFHELNETHLGFSSGRPSGRGWGYTQARKLHSVLKNSAAIRAGDLKDLSDYEMFIPGIGPDKISDLTTNIIKSELLVYTKEQCTLYDIPTQNVNSGRCWEPGTGDFISRYTALPLCDGLPVILVPKTAVRTRLIPDHSDFYSRFVLDYLEAELIDANDSLVKVLKSGIKKVFRKDLREKFPLTQEQLYEFSRRHPDVLAKYKATLPSKVKPIDNTEIEWSQRAPRDIGIATLGEQLTAIRPGSAGADKFHSLILGILQALFYPSLTRPVKEQLINEGRKRIDIKFDNSAERGFFADLVNKHRVFAPTIAIECKNYSQDPENPELDQLIGRFSRKRGNFGVLVCRRIDRPGLMLKRCRDVVNDTDGVVLVLDDEDILKLIQLKSSGDEQQLNDYLRSKLGEILM